MNDTELIQKIRDLKSETPSQEVLSALKKRVMSDIDDAPTISPVQLTLSPWYSRYPYALGGAIVAMILLVQTGTTAFPIMPLSARVALAPHAYAKSTIAVDALETAADAYRADPSDHNAQVLGQFVDKSRSELDKLKLVGESGKYTMGDCISAYRAYYSVIDSVIDLTSDPITAEKPSASQSALRETVRSAEAEARARLGAYPPEVQVQLMD